MTPAKQARVVAYLRVSTEQQSTEGYSLEAQERAVRSYAALYDLEIVAVVRDEGFSAKDMNRPGLKQVMRMLDVGAADGLLIAKLDRLTRSVRDLLTLTESYSLHSVAEKLDSSCAGGRMVTNILGVIAQWEREVIGERTKAALDAKRARGEYAGGKVPYGFKREGKMLVPNPEEEDTIALARGLRAAGLTFRDTAQQLYNRGKLTRQAGVFTHTAIAEMCRDK